MATTSKTKKTAKKKPVAKKKAIVKPVAKKKAAKPAPKKAPAKKAAPKKVAAKKLVKPAAKKTVVKKAAPKKPVAKKAPVKKSPVKKVAAKKLVAKKVAKPVAKKVPAKKAAPKKPVAKKAAKPAPKKAAAKKVAVKKVVAKKAVKPAAAPVQAPRPVQIDLFPVDDSAAMPEKLRHAAMKVLDERQAEDIVMNDLRGRSAIADYAIIASVKSGRQAAAVAEHLAHAFEKLGSGHVRVEGLTQGDWVLVDSGDVIVHIFRSEVRAYYALEEIWAKSAQRPV